MSSTDGHLPNDCELRVGVQSMKVLQLNSSDLIGSRFNGFDVRHLLAADGIETHHLVWNKLSDSNASSKFFRIPRSRDLTKMLGRIERAYSIHSRLQLQSFTLPLHRAFREADVVHYHIIHDGYFGLDALPWLSRLKPSIWTWHDPWPMTGHCIYPLGCERWRIGCGECPRLDLVFEMRRDRTAQDFEWKQRLIHKSDIDVVVASEHMRRMVQSSPIGRAIRLHCIPFGIDLQKFCPGDGAAARARLGVLPNRLVIGVRAFPDSPYKGFDFFLQALRRLGEINVPLCIVATHAKEKLNEFIGTHQIIDLGWTNDEALILDTFKAADFFVMPSTAEAFGMMAIEAMACGKAVIVFDGTSLPEVARAPDVGISVPMGDIDGLAAAIRRLAADEAERRARGSAGRTTAEDLYGDRLFAWRLAGLYRSVADKHALNSPSEAASQ
ncbi:glycosyltransferase [Bradyrhizobium sp. USDA 336]|uniref:glycosyltransferase n=1 Tax=Bradyrhizobium sp. USDA 336 TaxID=3156311 RepID=UPI003836E01F